MSYWEILGRVLLWIGAAGGGAGAITLATAEGWSGSERSRYLLAGALAVIAILCVPGIILMMSS